MGKTVKRKLRGMSSTAKVGLVCALTLLVTVFMYQGWYKPKGVQAAIPTVRAVGAVVPGQNNIVPTMPTGVLANDVLLLFVETAAEAVTLSGGTETWTQVTTPASIGTAGTGTRITVFWARASQNSPTSPTINDSGDHQQAGIIAFQGVITSGNPINVSATSTETNVDTSVSFPGVTTTVADTLVVVAMAGDLPDTNGSGNFSGWTNANLTNLTEQIDNTTTSGNGGALGVATGGKATAGASGSTTATLGTAAVKAMMTIALTPAPTTSGTLQFSNTTYSQSENGTSATITVTRTGGSSGAASVQYATSNGTATAGSDYTATSGTLN
jgi:hypothetical protein